MSVIKKILIFLVLVICFILIIWIVWTSYFYFRNKNDQNINKSNDNNIITEINKDKILENNLVSKLENDKVDEKLRAEFINYVEKNINDLTPYLSNNQEFWEIERFAFVSNDILYVVYKDKDVVGRVLVRCQKKNNDISCLKVSYYVPDNYSWKLEEGENPFYDKKIQYYEKDNKDNWQRTYTSDKITFLPLSPSSLQSFQELVDSDKKTWRLDPLEAVKYEIYDIVGFGLNEGEYKLILQKEDRAQVKVIYNNSEYLVYLYQPVKKGEAGIWVMEKILQLK